MTEKRALDPADLYRLRLISDPQISPDGRRVAFVLYQADEETNEYTSNIHLVEDGSTRQFTSGNKDSAPRWSPDGRHLAFLSGRNGKAQIHVMSAGGGESVAFTERKRGAGVPVWSPDSASIAFIGPVQTTPEEDEQETGDKKEPTKVIDRASYKLDSTGFIWNLRRHLFRIDVESRAVTQLTDGDFHDDNPAWSPDSRSIAFVSNRTPRWDISPESDVYIVDRDGGDARQVTSGHAFFSPVFSPDGSRIAVAGQIDPEDAFAPPRLFSVDLSGGDIRDEQGSWDGALGDDVASDSVRSENTSFIWRDDGLYFLATERGRCNVYRAQGGSVFPVTSGPQTVNGFSIAADGAHAYAAADATHLAEVYLTRDGETSRLTHESAYLDSVQVLQPEHICFRGALGEESEGWLLRPPGDGPFPLIVYLHGGPMKAHGEAFFFEYQFLAAHGFGVFFPNIHGSSSYGQSYQCSILRDWGGLDYEDVLAGTEAAASQPWVDGERLGIAGGSYGGFMTNWVMGHTDRFKAGVTERCLSNMVSFFGTTDHGWLWNRAWGFYPEEDMERLWDMSPIKYVENVRGALMVVHSERDDRCPIEQGEQMFNALRRLGKETRLIVFPEETHELSRSGTPSRRVERLGYIHDWFGRHL